MIHNVENLRYCVVLQTEIKLLQTSWDSFIPCTETEDSNITEVYKDKNLVIFNGRPVEQLREAQAF